MVQVDDVKIMQHEGLVRTDLMLSSGSYRMGANGFLQRDYAMEKGIQLTGV